MAPENIKGKERQKVHFVIILCVLAVPSVKEMFVWLSGNASRLPLAERSVVKEGFCWMKKIYCCPETDSHSQISNGKNKHASVTVNVDTVFEIDDAIVDVKRQVAEAVTNWNNRYVVTVCEFVRESVCFNRMDIIFRIILFIGFKILSSSKRSWSGVVVEAAPRELYSPDPPTDPVGTCSIRYVTIATFTTGACF